MNIHLFVIFGKHADDSPLVKNLRARGADVTVFADEVKLHFRYRWLLFLIGWPRLLLYSLKMTASSQYVQSKADVVLVNSHFDILIFSLRRILFREEIPPLVLPGFIYTKNRRPIIQFLKKHYYRWIMKNTAIAVCHSRKEIENNTITFDGCRTQFMYFPYAIHVTGADGFNTQTINSSTVLSAGRSGRDYSLLVKAVSGLDNELHIVCDTFNSHDQKSLPDNVQILHNCYDQDYLNELAQCRFVVVPLKVTDISAGQMVMLQAMAFGKPVVITRTQTTCDYFEDGQGVLYVEHGDLMGLRKAIERLCRDDQLCEELGRKAASLFFKHYSIDAYAKGLMDAAYQALKVINGNPEYVGER